MKKIFLSLFFLSFSLSVHAQNYCVDLFSIQKVEVHAVSSFGHRYRLNLTMANNFRMTVFAVLKESRAPEPAEILAKKLTEFIFYHPVNYRLYVEAISKRKNLKEIDVLDYQIHSGYENLFLKLSHDELMRIFMIGKSMQSRRKVILAPLEALRLLVSDLVPGLELTTNYYFFPFLYLKIYEPRSILLPTYSQLLGIDRETLSSVERYIEIHAEKLRKNLNVEQIMYPPSYQKPQEYLSVEYAPPQALSEARRLMRRVFVDPNFPHKGITLVGLGRGDLFLTMAHNLKYLESQALEQSVSGGQGLFYGLSADGTMSKVKIDVVKTLQPSEDLSQSMVVVRAQGLESVQAQPLLAPVQLKQDIHIFAFPAPRKLVRSIQNDGLAVMDYSQGQVVSFESNIVTTTALATVGSSGALVVTGKGEVVGLLWHMSPSFRASNADSENLKAAYLFGNLLAPQDYSYIIPWPDSVD